MKMVTDIGIIIGGLLVCAVAIAYSPQLIPSISPAMAASAIRLYNSFSASILTPAIIPSL